MKTVYYHINHKGFITFWHIENENPVDRWYVKATALDTVEDLGIVYVRAIKRLTERYKNEVTDYQFCEETYAPSPLNYTRQ